MTEVAHHVGLSAQFFSTPTSLTAGFGDVGNQSVRLMRIDPGNVDLSKVLDLDRISDEVAKGGISPTEGLAEVLAVDRRPPRYGGAWVVLAFSVVAAGAARFFGAGLTEILAALGAGFIAGSVTVLIPRAPRVAQLYELLAAAFVTLWVAGLQALSVPVAPFVAILSGLIVLVPGLSLTVAASELATKNLVSGSARLTSAGMSLLQMAFGVAVAQQLAVHWFGPLTPYAAVPLAPYTEAIALVVLATGLTVLFQAPLALLPAIIVTTAVAVLGARLGGTFLSPQLGASVGALFVAVLGNAYARIRRRPALVLTVPGMIMLVPGSLGFRSVSSMMAKDLTMGLETAFNMAVVAVAIVAGLLIANVLVPPATGGRAESAL